MKYEEARLLKPGDRVVVENWIPECPGRRPKHGVVVAITDFGGPRKCESPKYVPYPGGVRVRFLKDGNAPSSVSSMDCGWFRRETEEDVAKRNMQLVKSDADPKVELDFAASKAAKAEALDQVEKNASSEWLDEAEKAVRLVALKKEEFTSDDVWEYVGKPPEPRAMGAVMVRMVKLGVVERTGRFKTTAQASRHNAPIAIWKSKLFVPSAPETTP